MKEGWQQKDYLSVYAQDLSRHLDSNWLLLRSFASSSARNSDGYAQWSG